MDEVKEIKERVDIVQIISEKVRLNKSGKNYKGLCPFHSEKTPSFMVSADLQIYKCFGCGESGDVFSFLEKFEGLGFYEVLKFLAEKTGVTLKTVNQGAHKEREELYKINETAVKLYHYILTKHTSGKVALNYVANLRRISAEAVTAFKIGFAPNRGNPLTSYFRKKNIPLTIVEKTGAVAKANSRYFDRFHGGVVFPQFDKLGNPIGLAGRLLPEFDTGKMGKYINSPETELYKKSRVLYGLNVTKEEIKRARTAIIVEGEIDLISLWQAGFKNVAAIKGTALTMEQVQMLAKICDRVILALDSDFAGNQAAKRGIEIAQKENLQIDVLINKTYKDPDEFVRKDIKGLRVALNNTLSIWDFLLDNAFESVGVIKSSQDKVRAGNLVAPILKSIVDPIALADYVKKVAKRLEVSENAIRAKIGGTVENLGKDFEEENKQKIESNRYNTLEKKVLSLAFEHNPELLLNEEIQNLIVSRNLRILVKNFLAYATKNANFNQKEFFKELPPETSGVFSEIILDEVEKIEEKVILREIRELNLREKLANLTEKIKIYERKKQKRRLRVAQEKFLEISRALGEVRKTLS